VLAPASEDIGAPDGLRRGCSAGRQRGLDRGAPISGPVDASAGERLERGQALGQVGPFVFDHHPEATGDGSVADRAGGVERRDVTENQAGQQGLIEAGETLEGRGRGVPTDEIDRGDPSGVGWGDETMRVMVPGRGQRFAEELDVPAVVSAVPGDDDKKR